MTNGNGRGGNNRHKKNWRQKERDNGANNKSESDIKKNIQFHNDKNFQHLKSRPKWIPVKQSGTPIPEPICPACNKPIKELAQAIHDKNTGETLHFDCIRERVLASEHLEKGDNVTYIGGGRFGVVHFENNRNFTIKKIIEIEDNEKHAEWRDDIADHFSIT
ncbi:hypothetical protein AGMMS50212_07380 [Spirochaetia bacterium]|nr:hypothetical protein AGMMS50212_07380 [Spirochaetia bacterium]